MKRIIEHAVIQSSYSCSQGSKCQMTSRNNYGNKDEQHEDSLVLIFKRFLPTVEMTSCTF